MYKTAFVVSSLTLALLAIPAAQAADLGKCEQSAATKKLSGAAKDAHIKKCEKDVRLAEIKANCAEKSKEEKLAGAAKASFEKKCVKDANAEATATAPEAVDKLEKKDDKKGDMK